MSATLIGVSAGSGVPLFTRHIGHGKAPPYAMIASLNGVHVFGEAQGVTLWKSTTQNSTILWKTFHDSIRLIFISGSESCGDYVDHIVLELAFGSLVLLNGLNNIISQTNMEKLKKDLRLCYPVLDEILTRAVGAKENLFSHVTKCVDYIIPPDQLNIQPELEKYTESIESSYGCLLLMSGQILFATKSFWNLSRTELVLLSLFLSTKPLNVSVARDIPIYLPDRSPNVPYRMLITLLVSPLLLLCLCGSLPSLSESVKSASSFWGSHYLTLDAITAAAVCSIPSSIHSALDKTILGLLLVNYDTKRCLNCVHFRDKNDNRLSNITRSNKAVSQKSAVLSSVYRSLIGTVFQPPATPPEDLPVLNFQINHTPVQSYITTDEFRVFIIQKSPYHLLVLYSPLLPLHLAREITSKTLELLTRNKGIKI